MESVYKQQPGWFRLPVVAICEWLLVLPATVLLAAAALRMLQPRQYEPARTSWIIFEWTMTHVSRVGAAVLFIWMAGGVFAAGFCGLPPNLRKEQARRPAATTPFLMLPRPLLLGWLLGPVIELVSSG